MMFDKNISQFLLSRLPSFVLLFASVFFLLSAYYFYQYINASQLDQSVADKTIINDPFRYDNYLHAYSVGYLLVEEGNDKKAMEAFEIAEVSPELELRAMAKFAIGNIYFKHVMKDLAKEHGSRRIVEQVILAREAYKSVLRLKPDMHEARFNLELLDRLSPAKRTQGIKTGDGYTYQITPMLQDGRMHMKENVIRGLP
jgi:tetratricopeptide (TPR) repeat protein